MFDFLFGWKKRSSHHQIPRPPTPAFDPRARVANEPVIARYPSTIPPPSPLHVAGKYWSLDVDGNVGLVFGLVDSLREVGPVLFSIENELDELKPYGVLTLIVEPEVAFVLVRHGVLSSKSFITSIEQYGRIVMNDVLFATQHLRIEIALETSYPDFEFRVANHPERHTVLRGRSFEAGSITGDF
jgi:hypothetical protein